MTTAMQWVAADFGGAEVLQQRKVEIASPEHGEVTVAVRAVGMNPADYKHFGPGQDRSLLPLTVGYEVAGVVSSVGSQTPIATGPVSVGDEVLVFQISDGYSTMITVPADDVFAKPSGLSFPEAANLLLVGTTASEMIDASGVTDGDTVLLHGAAGAVGNSALQQLRLAGVTVVGTTSSDNFDTVRRFGGIPVEYGPGLAERVRQAAPDGISAALDTVGSDDAIDASLDLVEGPHRVVSIAGFARSGDGIVLLGAGNPGSGPYRARARGRIVSLAEAGDLVVPIDRTFPFDEARQAVERLSGRHPSGKIALVVE
ncbi:NADP-dependent oxidoreductase [Streptomyces sp. NPDC094468]|uniref:NADP-dependent oxidoreductase n=1 Tax=Streptomyces sp. NPDC094468 TaxID=3366066 RepID=UPI0038296C8C